MSDHLLMHTGSMYMDNAAYTCKLLEFESACTSNGIRHAVKKNIRHAFVGNGVKHAVWVVVISKLSWFVFAGIIGFVLVDALDVSAPLVVLLGAVLGVLGWATKMH